ncbi:diguanylate cyclase [Marinobacterium lacunae]|uniref:diguanylate cyclase n=1 Tax=Marinobacterium lacunae TaxID=1232683 RepID=A0A081FW49_9GAMM|nr:GGDEF domain-containing protein [Marinobacterium lacunae]KEA62754.1 diguanylate cyclase [Marinobacterium lacunae]
MPHFKHKYLDVRRLGSELLLAGLLFLAVFLIASELELADQLYAWTRHLEAYNLDEFLISACLVAPFYLILFGYRRLVEIRALVEEANTDVLTGILNRRRAMDVLAGEVRRAHRYRRDLAIILFDIDHFKDINDEYGHPVGDKVLRQFAALAGRRIRNLDLLARTGGEEFMVIATETSGAGATELAERLRVAIETTGFGIERTVTASFGVSQLRPGESFAALMQRADERLYWAKREGRNRVAGSTL